MKTIRGCSGFGDAIYLRCAVDYFFYNQKKNVIIYNNYPEIFEGYKLEPFNPHFKVDYDFDYKDRKEKKGTNQYQDMLINSGICSPDESEIIRYELEIPYEKYSRKKLQQVVVVSPYDCFGQSNGDQCKMRPSDQVFNSIIAKYSDITLINKQYPFKELVSIFGNADLVICQQGWGTALAEALDVECRVIFTNEALKSDNVFISSITPNKIFTKRTTKAIIV